MSINFSNLRRAVWHLRHGGFQQVVEWRRREKYRNRTNQYSAGVNDKIEARTGLSLPTASFQYNKDKVFNVRVAVILDDFSIKAWGPEWECIYITPSNWRKEIDEGRIDFLFVESAWAGNSSVWQFHLTGPTAPRPALVEVVSELRSRGIPTVFWNKEDPPHFEDFLETAKLFDFVFTSDSEMIPRYKSALGHDNVASLSFAAQPAFHNPVRRVFQGRKDVAFAGMYFSHKFPERRAQMDVVLAAAASLAEKYRYSFDIYSRQYGGDAKYQFPAPYDSYVVGSLPYERMLSAYKGYSVFLNVNSVVDSPSMCARRIFEITASGAAVVSTPSRAIEKFFSANEVIEVSDLDTARSSIRSLIRSSELRDRTVHLGQRRIWSEHTYSHRALEVLKKIGMVESVCASREAMTSQARISAVVSTIRPGQIEHIIATASKQLNVNVQLVLVLHKMDIDLEDVHRIARRYDLDDFVVFSAGESATLGDCLNLAVSACDGDFIAKMDDDDLYGELYLFDQVSALKYSGASIVGKQAHYMYLGSSDATLLRFGEREHRFTDLVMGPTILGHAEVFRNNPFQARNRGEDTQFLRDVADGGGLIYSADRFNFVQMRSKDGATHTWNLSDADLLATGTIQWFGRNDQHIFF
ncbi:glycosyltransferase [Glutamicibacter endophyticus]